MAFEELLAETTEAISQDSREVTEDIAENLRRNCESTAFHMTRHEKFMWRMGLLETGDSHPELTEKAKNFYVSLRAEGRYDNSK